MDASTYFELLRNRALPVVMDDEEAAVAVTALGFPVSRLEDYDFLTPQELPSLVVLTQAASIPRLHALWGNSAVRFCHLCLAKFDGSLQSLSDSFARLLSIDYGATLARRAETYDQLLSCQDVEIVTASGILRCHLNDELEIANAGKLVEPGWLYSIAEFFEASVVNLESDRSSFWVEGALFCQGLVYLCNSADHKERFGPQLDALLHTVAEHGVTLHVANNRIERIVAERSGQDLTATLMAVTQGRERESAVTELGFGCATFADAMTSTYDQNVVLNKSRLGAYVGIGKGHEMPHLDFIAPKAQLRFVSPQAED